MKQKQMKQKQITVSTKDADQQLCPCGSAVFVEAKQIYILSALADKNPTGKPMTLPVPAGYYCRACGEVLGEKTEAQEFDEFWADKCDKCDKYGRVVTKEDTGTTYYPFCSCVYGQAKQEQQRNDDHVPMKMR